ncbi:DNA mismatch repair protein MutT [Afifella sp. IM 167]|nr:DNA mismatch repair protein MutT [Afifella sp. IM 167]
MQRSLLAASRLRRGMTLGVRAALIAEGRILLVRHTYVPGWYLPGGGVEAGETTLQAVTREIREETGSELSGEPELFGIYRNFRAHPNDHVVLYVCRDFRRLEIDPTGMEIAEIGDFALGALPEDATPSTRARIAEIGGQAARTEDW